MFIHCAVIIMYTYNIQETRNYIGKYQILLPSCFCKAVFFFFFSVSKDTHRRVPRVFVVCCEIC